MQTISDRIKLVRLNADGKKMTQEEFGRRLGISRGAVTNLEDAENRLPNGVSDSTIRLICATFHINYQWLTEGKEPMYADTDPDSLVDRYAPNESEYFKAAVRGMMNLSDDAWIKLRDFVEDMRKKQHDGDLSDES